MKLVPATVDNGTAKASGLEVKLPKPVSAAKGTLGFRPEAVTDRVVDGGPSMKIKVDVVERLGSDPLLYGQGGPHHGPRAGPPPLLRAPCDTAPPRPPTPGLPLSLA